MSHKVIIKPRPLQTNHPIEIKMQALRHISSFFKNGFPFNPLTRAQVEKWMPSLVNMDTNEKGFREAVEKYFIEMSIPVPYAGKELEIGLDSQGEPINKEEYIMYLFALGKRTVAKNKSDFDKDALYDFWIDDPKDFQEAREKAYNATLEASLIMAELDKDPEKAALVLAVLNPGLLVHTMSRKEVNMELADLMRVNPERFTTVSKAKNLDAYAQINSLSAAKVISTVGQTYIYQDITLGNNLNEVVAFMNNPTNSAVVRQMKAKLQQIKLSSQPKDIADIISEAYEYTEDANTPEATAKAGSK